MRQGAEAQVPLLQAPDQVQGQHNEAHCTCTPAFAVPTSQRLIVWRIYFPFFAIKIRIIVNRIIFWHISSFTPNFIWLFVITMILRCQYFSHRDIKTFFLWLKIIIYFFILMWHVCVSSKDLFHYLNYVYEVINV